MKKIFTFCFILMLTSSYAQDWEKVTDYMGLESHCSALPYIGTNDGVVMFANTYTNEWHHVGLKGEMILALYRNSNGITETILCGTNEGLFFSDDQGVNWLKTDLPDYKVNKIYYSHSYIACTSSGVYKSDDAISWTFYALKGKDVKRYVDSRVNNIKGYLCHDAYYYTEDNGETFIPAVLNEGMWGFTDIQLSTSNYYMAISDTGGIYSIHRDSVYFAKVATWEKHNNGIEDKTITFFTMNGEEFQVGTNDGYYRSQNSGKVFIKQTYFDANLTSREITQFNFQTTTFITTLSSGVFYNGEVRGFANIQTLQLAPDGSMFIGTNGFGIYQSSDNGQTWKERNIGLLNKDVRDIEFSSNGKLYAATAKGAFVSEDNGLQWGAIKPLEIGLFSLMESASKDGLTVFGSGKNTFYWLGSNFNWNGGIDNLNDNIYAITYHPKMNIYLAGGRYGLWQSETSFVQWTKVKTFPSYSIYDLEIDSQGRILAVTKGNVYYSDDKGESWEKTAPIPKNDKTDLVIGIDDAYYVATDGGVYYSTDRGLSWEEMNNGFVGLPNYVMVQTLAIDEENYLWAGTTTSGLYRSKSRLSGSARIEHHKSDPELQLKVSYEKSSEMLQLELSKKLVHSSTLSIFTLDGKLICTNRIEKANNKYYVAVRNLNSNIYLLSLKSAEDQISQKFIVK